MLLEVSAAMNHSTARIKLGSCSDYRPLHPTSTPGLMESSGYPIG